MCCVETVPSVFPLSYTVSPSSSTLYTSSLFLLYLPTIHGLYIARASRLDIPASLWRRLLGCCSGCAAQYARLRCTRRQKRLRARRSAIDSCLLDRWDDVIAGSPLSACADAGARKLSRLALRWRLSSCVSAADSSTATLFES